MNETKLQAPTAWKLVPVEPTPEMLSALHVMPDCIGSAIVRHSVDKLPDAYADMLAAAPHPVDAVSGEWTMVPAAPAPATWSSATAPGPDGMQHCIAVPGMPSAARDEALEEAAAVCDAKRAARVSAGHPREASTAGALAEEIRALKSIAGPVASAPVPVQQAAPGGKSAPEFIQEDDEFMIRFREFLQVVNGDGTAYAESRAAVIRRINAWHAEKCRAQPVTQVQQAAPRDPGQVQTIRERLTNAPVQQAAPSGYTDGLRAGLMQGASIARHLYVQHCHHDGVEGLLKRCEQAEQKLLEAAVNAAPAQPVGLLEQAIDACDACMDVSQVEPEDAAAWQVVRAAIRTASPVGLSDLDAIKQAASAHGYVLAWAGHTTLNDCAKYGWHAGEVQSVFSAALQSGKTAPTSGKSPLASGLSEQDRLDAVNSRLIAAAPALLAALESMLADAECFAKHLQNSRCVDDARAAILAAKEAP